MMQQELPKPSGWTIAFVLVRTITYATLFVGFLLVFLPARVLSWSGIVRPPNIGAAQVVGLVVGTAGTLVAVAAFALITHLFVVVYEEPALSATFGDAYVRYCQSGHRWWPRLKGGINDAA